MKRKKLIESLKKEKNRVLTYAIAAGIVSATVIGIKSSKANINNESNSIIKNLNYYSSELKYDDIKDLSVIQINNNVLNKNKYYIVKQENDDYKSPFDNKVICNKNDENDVITINKLGILKDFIVTYNYFNEYYTEGELDNLLNKIVKDLPKEGKELIFRS